MPLQLLFSLGDGVRQFTGIHGWAVIILLHQSTWNETNIKNLSQWSISSIIKGSEWKTLKTDFFQKSLSINVQFKTNSNRSFNQNSFKTNSNAAIFQWKTVSKQIKKVLSIKTVQNKFKRSFQILKSNAFLHVQSHRLRIGTIDRHLPASIFWKSNNKQFKTDKRMYALEEMEGRHGDGVSLKTPQPEGWVASARSCSQNKFKRHPKIFPISNGSITCSWLPVHRRSKKICVLVQLIRTMLQYLPWIPDNCVDVDT